MDERLVRRARSLLFNNSRSIGHVHLFGSSRRRDLICRLVKSNDTWEHVFCDFIYADGSMKLLLSSLGTALHVKPRGDHIDDFFYNLSENYNWKQNTKKLLIILENSQAVVNFSPIAISSFLNSHKLVPDMQIRFVTSAPAAWPVYNSHISLGCNPIPEIHIQEPDLGQCVLEAVSAPGVSQQFAKFAVDTLFLHCNESSTLSRVTRDAARLYAKGGSEKFEVSRAGDCIKAAASERIGIVIAEKSSGIDHIKEAFQAMPPVMRYLLISAYCASHNSVPMDKRFFAKHHGKEKRSEARELQNELKRQLKDPEPKAADWQRVVCIFETFVNAYRDVPLQGFDINAIASSLCAMGLIGISSLSLSLDQPRMTCLISLESALKVADSLKINLRDYLEHAN